jgi:starvation-inducible outer membrane lipoprotein
MLAVLLACALFITGCHTVSESTKGASVGAKKDYQEVKKADAWLQENLW